MLIPCTLRSNHPRDYPGQLVGPALAGREVSMALVVWRSVWPWLFSQKLLFGVVDELETYIRAKLASDREAVSDSCQWTNSCFKLEAHGRRRRAAAQA